MSTARVIAWFTAKYQFPLYRITVGRCTISGLSERWCYVSIGRRTLINTRPTFFRISCFLIVPTSSNCSLINTAISLPTIVYLIAPLFFVALRAALLHFRPLFFSYSFRSVSGNPINEEVTIMQNSRTCACAISLNRLGKLWFLVPILLNMRDNKHCNSNVMQWQVLLQYLWDNWRD